MINRLPNSLFGIFFLFTVVSLSILVPLRATAELLDRVVAVVNDEIITASELQEEGKEYFEQVRKTTPSNKIDDAVLEAKSRVLDNMVSQRLITQEAKKAGIDIEDEEFSRAYQENRNNLNLNDKEFKEKLARSGLTEKKYKSNIKSQLLRDKLVLFEVRSKIIITEEMIKEHYDTEYTKEVESGGFYLLQIGFSWDADKELNQSDEIFESDKIQARMRAEEARQMVLDGKDFATVARQQSELPSAADGGDIGVLQEDDMASSMKDAILPLKAGEVSPVLETASGYQFFKLLSRQEGDTVEIVPFDSVKEEIRKKLFEQKFKQEFNKWVEDIKKQSYIKKMLF